MSAPSMSRRHAAGAESARGLLLTLLGEFVLPAGGVGLDLGGHRGARPASGSRRRRPGRR